MSVFSTAHRSTETTQTKLLIRERTIDEIRKQSQIMADLESQGKIKIVGAMYDIASGKVTFM